MAKTPRRRLRQGVINQVEHFFGLTERADYHRLVIVTTYFTAGGEPSDLGQPSDVDEWLPHARALVDHGRWIINCPDSGCVGAIMAQEGWPFICPFCVDEGKRYRNVDWPDPGTRTAVEQNLLLRPQAENRNWNPLTETLEDIVSETKANA